MKCLLCENDKEKMAKAHIFPIGFFNKIETKGQVATYRASGEKGRRLHCISSDLFVQSCPKLVCTLMLV